MKTRHLKLMRLLNRQQLLTARELAEACGVSLRTIQRDLLELEAKGYPIYSERGPAGGYRVLPNRLLPPLALREQEAITLFLMLDWVGQIPDLPFGALRGNLAEWYLHELPGDLAAKLDRLKGRVRFARPDTPASPLTRDVLHLMEAEVQGEITYQTTNGLRTIVIDPVGLTFDRNRWYLLAQTDRGLRQYRVDRMEQVTETTTPSKRMTFEEAEHLNEAGEQVTVRLELTPLGERLLEGILTLNAFRTWSVPVAELPFLGRQLFGLGREVKVLAPLRLREEIRHLATELLAQYED
ncbi:WYL domain-containing protein [Exiguobacterium antarcticum]|uniref:WYL domain-containing protein n=1 Tax=Exiguobacterium antarcticum TaxID=132920 RepID=A0ABT6R5V7_9BACL|nr:WYL domain-containing protein [Exiguobacterium antarcticum]MDI3236348.1 WYL domain-containing protein [Exiguobacterium antarcticum]